MKKCLLFLALLALLLTGCGAKETFETVSDVYAPEEAAPMQQIVLNLTDSAAAQTMECDGNRLYFCDGYTVTVQTLTAGDLDRTLREITGFSRQTLRPVETATGELRRYDCVWTAAGETEEQVGRAAVLDDGNYHYAVTVMADASAAGDLAGQWQTLLDSFRVIPAGTAVNTGS